MVFMGSVLWLQTYGVFVCLLQCSTADIITVLVAKVLNFYQIYANINTRNFICLSLFSQLKVDLLSSYFLSLIYSYGHFGRCIRSTAH